MKANIVALWAVLIVWQGIGTYHRYELQHRINDVSEVTDRVIELLETESNFNDSVLEILNQHQELILSLQPPK